MNRLFVADKPIGISSNHFLTKLKRKYGVKKAGFSGTLDPFASGCLIVAFGNYTRFFRFLDKTPKTYITTMWFGVKSESFDNQNIQEIKILKAFDKNRLKNIISTLKGEIEYTPPKYSAKKIDGQRAYKLALQGQEFEMKKNKMNVYECEIINYMHPFLTIKISVSEGSYIRSYAQIFAQNLGINITLSALKRVSEGRFKFEDEIALNPIKYLNLEYNFYNSNLDDIRLGKKLDIGDFSIKKDGDYLLDLDGMYSIIQIENDSVSYLLNRIEI
ncbi:tRNA pseudouridine 55 synthase [Campylobacter blaseri]|uniref:tRNA pseudouridine synthase B n=1 Tax=Campylobacter blaseri TaxID=2042961 RepID=A0A2P8R1Z1_9BACT|nr:tRNA pseudouridine(55) synthase TruB [Campylobacter blaseri]PSM52498.1 tRNA pseudouridine(55) synthase TruB [Campylobacter blaseri]PSM54146.1 tRNA pseudouridine(55) synthase TruB [Campylobacter blaseri]QKF85794.1 tRNA pseudouridine 55 synthase [Campylobacter blaseri]